MELLAGAIALHEIAGSALNFVCCFGHFVRHQPRRPARSRLLWGSGEEIDAEAYHLRLAYFWIDQADLLV